MPRETHLRQRSADLCTVVVQRKRSSCLARLGQRASKTFTPTFQPLLPDHAAVGTVSAEHVAGDPAQAVQRELGHRCRVPGAAREIAGSRAPSRSYGSSTPCSKGLQGRPIIDDPHGQHLGRRSDPLWCRVLRRAGPQTGCGSREPAPALIQPPGVWDGRRIGIKRMRWRRINEPMPVTT